MEGEQEPEVITDFLQVERTYCTYSLIYRYEPAQNRYIFTRHNWAHTGYKLEDLVEVRAIARLAKLLN